MKKTFIFTLLSLVTILIISACSTSGEDLSTETHSIVISTGDNSISVDESLTIKGDSNETIYSTARFWVQDGASDVSILINNNPSPCNSSGNYYTCNISSLNISMESTIQATMSYTLSKDIESFTKMLTYDTSSLSVEFDKENIFSGTNMKAGNSFVLKLYKPGEAPLSWYIIAIISLLIILLLVLTMYSFRKQKTMKIKEIAGESEELLNTKKNLLMSLLKDVEKQHRSKDISDDTYHKLKEQYKQDAVITMKKLEDMKSEVK